MVVIRDSFCTNKIKVVFGGYATNYAQSIDICLSGDDAT
jgi:hypothetical protein